MKSPHYLKYEKSDKIVLKFAFFKDLFYIIIAKNEGGIVVPLTDDDFVKTGKLEGYSEMIQKLHEEEQTQPEITYDLQLDDDEDEEEK